MHTCMSLTYACHAAPTPMLHRPGTAKQLAARQRGVLLFAADSDMDNDELSLIANKITVTTCFASELFSNYDVAKCMAGYCGM